MPTYVPSPGYWLAVRIAIAIICFFVVADIFLFALSMRPPAYPERQWSGRPIAYPPRGPHWERVR